MLKDWLLKDWLFLESSVGIVLLLNKRSYLMTDKIEQKRIILFLT